MATDYFSKETSALYSQGAMPSELTLKPVVLNPLGNVENLHVLDIGCGFGSYSMVMAQKGAHVVGIDISAEQIETARKYHNHPNITYLVQDLTSATLGNHSFDIVLSNLVVPDLDSGEKVKDLFSLARRVMKSKGRFVFSVLHPFYLTPNQNKEDMAVDFQHENYFNEGSTYHARTSTNAGHTIVFNETHYSLTFISELLQTDFLIERIVESEQLPEQGISLPKFLVFECVARVHHDPEEPLRASV